MKRDRDSYDTDVPRYRLYRNTEDGVFMGVCAGLADYFGFDRLATRIVTVAAAFFFAPTIIIAYLLLGFLLKKAPKRHDRRDHRDDALRQRIWAEPHASLDSVRHRFRELDRRLQRLETVVTSRRYRLEREFDGLRD
jgi:phage shock protein C